MTWRCRMRSLPSAGVELSYRFFSLLISAIFLLSSYILRYLLTFAIPIILDLLCSLRPEDYNYLPTYD
jgi:hypothetical protein